MRTIWNVISVRAQPGVCKDALKKIASSFNKCQDLDVFHHEAGDVLPPMAKACDFDLRS